MILQTGAVVLSTVGISVSLGEHQVPTMSGEIGCRLLDRGGVLDVQGQVVQSRAAAGVLNVGQAGDRSMTR